MGHGCTRMGIKARNFGRLSCSPLRRTPMIWSKFLWIALSDDLICSGEVMTPSILYRRVACQMIQNVKGQRPIVTPHRVAHQIPVGLFRTWVNATLNSDAKTQQAP